MLGQEPAFGDDQTIGDVLAGALAPLRRMVADVERLSLDLADDSDEPAQAAYAVALDRAVAHDAWDADRRAAEARRAARARGARPRRGGSARCPAASAPGWPWPR